MNLKEAARTLGVHYQTAYKWVRSGELTAVRIGTRYEVSTAAIDQFIANRRTCVIGEAHPTPGDRGGATDVPPEDLLEELEAMASDLFVTIPSTVGFLARRTAEVIGDVSIISIDDADGSDRSAMIEHPRADRAAFFNAVMSLSGASLMEQSRFLHRTLAEGVPTLIPFIDQISLRSSLLPEFKQYLELYPIHSMVAAAFKVNERVRGVIVLTRDHPGQPYTTDDVRLLERIAARVGTLIQTADEIEAAWQLRATLAQVARDAVLRRPPHRPMEGTELRDLLFAPGTAGGESGLPCLAFSPDERVLAANPAFERISDVGAADAVGLTRSEMVPPPLRDTEAPRYARLRSGEIDYDDCLTWRGSEPGPFHRTALHRVAVRDLDATLACVITVARLIHHASSDHLNVLDTAVSAVQRD